MLLCDTQIQLDSQFCGVLGNVIWYFGEFLVGAVDRGALAATLLGAGQVGEAVPSELAAVILSTCSQSQPQCHCTPSPRKHTPVPAFTATVPTQTLRTAKVKVVTQQGDFETLQTGWVGSRGGGGMGWVAVCPNEPKMFEKHC